MDLYKEMLYSRTGSSELKLERMQKAADFFGSPEKRFLSLHVAGTNGKGSVCTKLARNLEMCGLKVGLYTSPHISSLRERIQINGQMVEEDWLRKHVELMPKDLSFFEIMTLLSFLYFAEEKVDIAVIEVGLGGRLDATNIIRPELSIITSIDYDHQDLLGATLEAIAFEKAGIIKEGVPYILGPSAARFIEGPLVSLPGNSYDEENSNLVRLALSHLNQPIFEEALSTRPSCRLEKIGPVILDVAHNPGGFTRLFEALPPKPYAAIIGMSLDKDIEKSLAIISSHVQEAHFVQARSSRAAAPSYLQSLWSSKKPSYIYNSIEEGLAAALLAGPVIATGSFYIMGPLRRALGLVEPLDESVFQESFKS
ncbi:MAG: Mur ligase family protein [Chlamydiota bacterium]